MKSDFDFDTHKCRREREGKGEGELVFFSLKWKGGSQILNPHRRSLNIFCSDFCLVGFLLKATEL